MADATVELLKVATSAVAGGIAGHFTARRSERDTAIKDLLQDIRGVADLAEEYWCEGADSTKCDRLAKKLKAKVKDFASLNTRIAKRFPTYRFLHPAKIIALRQAITDGDFDKPGRPVDTARVERIHDAAAGLRSAVEDARRTIFQVPPREWLRAYYALRQQRNSLLTR